MDGVVVLGAEIQWNAGRPSPIRTNLSWQTLKSLKKPVLALGVIFAAFTALCAGLLRMFLRPGLPTPASAGRTLDLPVLGAAPLKQPA